MDIAEFLAANAAMMLGAIVQAASGVGGGFVIVPILAWLDIGLVPSPLIFASLALSTLMAIRERGAIEWQGIPTVLTGLIPGSLAGAYVVSSIPTGMLGLVFGSVILLGVLISISGVEFRRTRTSSLIAGALSGAMGTSSGIGAPLLALLYQGDAGPRVRATLAVLYTGASILIIFVLIGFGQFSLADARSGATLMPGLLVGYLIASRFTVRVDRGGTRIAVLCMSSAAALALIARSISAT